jgi:pilus assembly protein Flp/PilA
MELGHQPDFDSARLRLQWIPENSQIEWELAISMKRLEGLARKFCGWIRELERDAQGQDLIEYALMAGFVAVAAAASMPNINSNLSVVFSKVSSVMTVAAAS